VELARRGVRVTGVDRSPFMLDRARERASAHQVDIDWILSDMRDFDAPAQYDLVLSLFTSFGYFEDEEDNARVLRRVRQSLRPGGCFVLDTMNKERLAAVFSPAHCSQTEDGRLLVERRRILPDWEQIESTWYVLDAGHYEAFTIRHWLYSGAELRRLLVAAGFGSVALYGSYAGAPFTGDARLHIVARA
jgi:SAM-dependent methyltransferase